eukprot:TRINITY_DN3143_c0_g3_i1.p1 TRINITY_DN3143_c0_g3~~TRINITY_DN3143_c0_g3_i1.p1  ORF type:complete len:238 (-),score=45.76 TRINITY_DN3143_c0_g3_i1:492-1205(-)
MLGTSGNCSATAVAPHTQLFSGENATRSGIAILIRVNWFGNWSESTMGTWAQLVGGTTSSIAGSGRTFAAQTAYATGQSAPLTSSWLTETLAAVQTFQVAANVTVMSSLDVGGVVVSTPSSNTLVEQCGAPGSGVLCTALVPSIIVSGFFIAMFICAIILNRHLLFNGGCSRFVANVLGDKTLSSTTTTDDDDKGETEPYGQQHEAVNMMDLDNHHHREERNVNKNNNVERYYTTSA